MSLSPVVRFAPSPTGYLHIGGARTALFNYLYARRHQGKFLLRIEDTDQERSTEQNTQAILEGLKWMGIDWDGEPVIQTSRRALHEQKIQELLKMGKAYKCFMTKEELEARREAQKQAGQTPRYDGREAQLKNQTQDKPFVVRFLVPKGSTTVRDVVKGNVTFQNTEIEDFVLARSDGSPIYNFVATMDDIDMGITHVIRGDDHLNNTPKQVLLYEAFGKPTPIFAHVPLILGPDRQRLSKRHGATSVQMYRDMGYLPHALVNFLVRLGWSHKDQEIFSLEEMIAAFDLEHIGTSAGVFNAEKLLWLNHHYIKTEKFEVLMAEIKRHIQVPVGRENTPEAQKTIELLRERSKTIKEMADLSRFYFLDEFEVDEKSKAQFVNKDTKPQLEFWANLIEQTAELCEAALKPSVEAYMKDKNLKMPQMMQPMRVSLTGSTFSPSVYDLVMLMGKERAVKKIKKILSEL